MELHFLDTDQPLVKTIRHANVEIGILYADQDPPTVRWLVKLTELSIPGMQQIVEEYHRLVNTPRQDS